MGKGEERRVKHQCDSCLQVYDDDSLPKTHYQIHKLATRVEPGQIMPSGECSCGALTYVVEPIPEQKAG